MNNNCIYFISAGSEKFAILNEAARRLYESDEKLEVQDVRDGMGNLILSSFLRNMTWFYGRSDVCTYVSCAPFMVLSTFNSLFAPVSLFAFHLSPTSQKPVWYLVLVSEAKT